MQEESKKAEMTKLILSKWVLKYYYKERQFITKSVHYSENKKTVSIHTHKNKAQKYRKQILRQLKGETGKSTVISEDFNTLLSMIYKFTIPKISQGIEDINNNNKLKSEAIPG